MLATPINQHAPVKTKQLITIYAPVEKVWQVFTDVNYWKHWQKDISSSKLSTAFAVNQIFYWKSGGLTIRSTLHTVENNSLIGWSGKAFGAMAIHNWQFEKRNDTTVVTVEESMEGWLVRWFKNMFQSKLITSTQRWLNYLKNECERNTTPDIAITGTHGTTR